LPLTAFMSAVELPNKKTRRPVHALLPIQKLSKLVIA
jgi:hypothetical protein